MRIALIGAVESTGVTLEVLCARGQVPVAVLGLPLALKDRHSDFVDMQAAAGAAGAPFFPIEDVNSDEAIAILAGLQIDWLIVVGWSQICSPRVLATASQGAIGYHPAALPKLRGRAVIAWTILLGLMETAGSLFFMAAEVDSGALLAQHRFEVDERETVHSLLAKHMQALRAMWAELLPIGKATDMRTFVQDDAKATYCARRFPADGEIVWTQVADAVDRLVRAVSSPYPGAFTSYRGRRLFIDSARVWNGPTHYGSPGQVLQRADDHFLVSCGEYTALQVDGWRWADGAEGRAPPVGRTLGQS